MPLKPDPTFYPSPASAAESPVEKLAYVVTLNTGTNGDQRPDFSRRKSMAETIAGTARAIDSASNVCVKALEAGPYLTTRGIPARNRATLGLKRMSLRKIITVLSRRAWRGTA